MTTLLDRIRAYDTEYDPVGAACAAAGIPRGLFTAALNRVFYDGYYGPVSPESWIQAHDGEEHAAAVSRTTDALQVLERVSDRIESYYETRLGIDEDGEEVEWTEESVSADELRRELLHVVYDIYGALPW